MAQHGGFVGDDEASNEKADDMGVVDFDHDGLKVKPSSLESL